MVEAMTDVWLVTADCGDYYCEGEHVIGVATTEAEAERVKAEAEAATWGNRYGASGKRWNDVSVAQVQTDALFESAASVSYG